MGAGYQLIQFDRQLIPVAAVTATLGNTRQTRNRQDSNPEIDGGQNRIGGMNCLLLCWYAMRGGAVAARQAHNLEVAGSNPAPATYNPLKASEALEGGGQLGCTF
jgi:hypothetical protein